jgi:predicted dehydrogenase
MAKVRFGVLSTAKIGVEKVIPAMQKGQSTAVVAIASRSLEKARAATARLGIPTAHGTYDALLADPAVDAVYIPLPNDQHVSWSIRALEAGKHVLCEKPIGLSLADARTLADAAQKHPRLKLMEAFMYRHHPQWRKTKELVDSGAIGKLRTIQTFFSFYNEDPANIRHDPAMGGGSLMDIGCYPISLSRWLFGGEPRRVLGVMEYDPRFNVDRLTSAVLDFGVGTATFTCSMQVSPYQAVQIIGTEGRIELSDVPFNAPNDRPCVVRQQQNAQITSLPMDVCDQYTIQGDLFARAILDDAPVPTPFDDAVHNMATIDAIVKSAQISAWVAPRFA